MESMSRLSSMLETGKSLSLLLLLSNRAVLTPMQLAISPSRLPNPPVPLDHLAAVVQQETCRRPS